MIIPHPSSRSNEEGEAGAAAQGTVVWVLIAGEPVAVPVSTGVSDGRRTQIVSGELAPGDAVITDAVSAE
jgi:HlyD family secretion protein